MKRHLVSLLAVALTLSGGIGAAGAASPPPEPPDGGEHQQHGPSAGHLPASSENVEVVGKRKLTSHNGDISDVSALQTADGRWFAYLGDWSAHCETGGVHVVDFTDPANPTKAGYLNSGGFGYVTEGVHALSIDTDAFTGDILVISNEWCRASGNPKNMPGGITIWDITEPTQPKQLVRAFGDFDVHGNRANESHSAIAWDAGNGKAYVAAIDNEELDDVDIFDITDPRKPVLIAETDLPGVTVTGYGENEGSHDLDVLQFEDGSWHLMVSDWDGGWVDVDVTDPANPVVLSNFEYAECDQVIELELGKCLQPEGNAHQGEWTADASLFIGTDEDFSPYRLSPITVTEHTSGPGAVPNQPAPGTEYEGGEFGFTVPIATIEDGVLNGPLVFGGYGCPEDDQVPPASVLDPFLDPDAESPEERILVTERGPVNDPNAPYDACFFSDKIRLGEEKGYDAVIVANHHLGAGAGAAHHAFICGGQGSPVLGIAHGLCTGHAAMHELFGRTPDFTVPYPLGDPGDLEPNPGDVGPKVEVTSEFDGWGYVRLLDATTMTEIDQLYIPEAFDEEFATGFGDLTVHEVEVPRGDPNEGGPAPDDGKLAYLSWYSGGFRVAAFDDEGIDEVGHFIDEGGNDFWGVALAKDQNGDRIILASDRDFGLYIFRYTGPMERP
jgi:hypothetical protein